MIAEFWTRKEESGVLLKLPLLLNACRANAFGSITEYRGGRVENALFTFLSGVPDEGFFRSKPELFFEKFLVCMTPEWEDFLKRSPFLKSVMLRRMMKPVLGKSVKSLAPLPNGYRLMPFDANAFSAHPFGHGANYADFDDFSKRGSGAVILHENEIVSSASSFLTFDGGVELDVSTAPSHRGKGLADHCVFAMMEDCASRNLTVHWDAQNLPSTKMAESHGFTVEQEYAVYLLKH